MSVRFSFSLPAIKKREKEERVDLPFPFNDLEVSSLSYSSDELDLVDPAVDPVVPDNETSREQERGVSSCKRVRNPEAREARDQINERLTRRC